MDPQDQTFMTIHNLSDEANILFASDSILDILGYHPDEVQNKSSFEFFHPAEEPFARAVHRDGLLLDKAAVLHYARIRARDGRWVNCECCFTIVHDVLVASTSIYLRGEKSERRKMEAPHVRRIFSSSPRDPRYHMLEHLSPKFKMPPTEREPRAALILNRFTRNLSIMFATNSVTSILGMRPDELKDRPFYECIQPNCLQDAVRCLESAKANESIAYLRFWFQDPRVGRDHDDDEDEEEDEEDEDMDDEDESDDRDSDDLHSNKSDAGRAQPGDNCMKVDQDPALKKRDQGSPTPSVDPPIYHTTAMRASSPAGKPVYHTPLTPESLSDTGRVPTPRRRRQERQPAGAFELEAVVSCTSDGLVVVLRRARPPIPHPHPPLLSPAFNFENGLFAAPWGQQPIEPYISPELLYNFRPPFLPQFMPVRESVKAAGGPPLDQLMSSIRDVAVFAWALAGINGTMANYSHGLPRGEALPPDGLPVWDPNAGPTAYRGPENQAASRSSITNEGNGLSTVANGYDGSYRRAETAVRSHAQVSSSLNEYTYESHQQPGPMWSRHTAAARSPAAYEPAQRQFQAAFMLDTAQQRQVSPPLPPVAVPATQTCSPQTKPTTHETRANEPSHNTRYLWQ
ncbi:hypothetical protein B0H63DRAFT_519682 [Podospora didyma]|uniref:PAS domain-containing protein n=1 Tax=Podospora didyma TaxID=330526 RepID=A0AAE0NZ82_9PEZI|nr:hypothetical protein B0H63DRAFT_519682 [Podospora didyma]